MKRKALSWTIIIFAVLGFLFVYLETEFGFSNGVLIGIGFLGFSSVGWGIEEFSKKQESYSIFDQDNSRKEAYRRIAAITSSLVLILIGVGMIAASGLGLIGLGDIAIQFIRIRPGILLIFLGTLGFSFSFQLITGSEESKKSFWLILGSIPGRIFGVILLLVSIAVILAGILEALLPEKFFQLIRSILSHLNLPDFL